MLEWTYNNQVVSEPPTGAYGFIYEITALNSGRRYIGRKYLTKASYYQKKGKRKKTRKESDWRDYWSSSPELLLDLEKHGKDNFERKILTWCFSRAECNYLELKYLFDNRVLESDQWYNSNIGNKHWKRLVINFPSNKHHSF